MMKNIADRMQREQNEKEQLDHDTAVVVDIDAEKNEKEDDDIK